MLPKDNLTKVSNSLTSTHLGLALENFYRLKETDNNTNSNGAFSVILHSYFGLESAINSIGYDLFENKDSSHYIAKHDRPIHLSKFIGNWGISLPCIDKLDFVFSHNKSKIPAQLNSKIRELNTLRNKLAHGISYSTTFLLEETDESMLYKVIDYEYSNSKQWKDAFPNCKFNSISHIDASDAEKALRIVLEILIELTKINPLYIFSLSLVYNGPQFHVIH